MQMMGQLGQPITADDAKAMLHEADLDGDGKIEYAELVRMMSHPDPESLLGMPASKLNDVPGSSEESNLVYAK